MDGVVGGLDEKGPAVAAENVGGDGFGVRAVVAGALEEVVADATGDVSGGGLCVDDEVFLGEFGPHVVDVAGKVLAECRRLLGDEVGRGENSDELVVGVAYAELIPGLVVFLRLRGQRIAESRGGVRWCAEDRLLPTVGAFKFDPQGQAHEIDSSDVGVDAIGCRIRQLCKPIILLRAWISSIHGRGLDQSRSIRRSHDIELQEAVDHPHPRAGDVVGEGQCQCRIRLAHGDRNVPSDLDRSRRVCGRIQIPAVLTQHDQSSPGIQTSNVHMHLFAGPLVHDAQGEHATGRSRRQGICVWRKPGCTARREVG